MGSGDRQCGGPQDIPDCHRQLQQLLQEGGGGLETPRWEQMPGPQHNHRLLDPIREILMAIWRRSLRRLKIWWPVVVLALDAIANFVFRHLVYRFRNPSKIPVFVSFRRFGGKIKNKIGRLFLQSRNLKIYLRHKIFLSL